MELFERLAYDSYRRAIDLSDPVRQVLAKGTCLLTQPTDPSTNATSMSTIPASATSASSPTVP